mmetsp:Transcript_9872/g.26333  ORF Transcript_9872/g.26333 Transcript_9872/m.26333 type:complete len:288 (-) Transcript_9872:1460-2323(-)
MHFFSASRSSTLAQSFLYLVTSAWAAVSRVWNLSSSALTSAAISLPLASICLWVMYLRASASAVLASTSAFRASSAAVRMSLAELSKSLASSPSSPAASTTRFTSSSALQTSLSASLMVACFFRSAVDFFSSRSFSEWALSLAWSSLSLAVVSSLRLGARRFASTSFVAMNILAMETAVFAAVEAVSQAFTHASVSATGSSSTPMRKGPSESAAFVTDSATACSLPSASFSTSSHPTFSVASLCCSLRSISFFSEALHRSSSFMISSRASPAVTCFFESMNLATAAR